MSTNAKVTASRNSIGLGTILFLIFLVLKLTNYITWSWWWVTAPLWMPAAIVIAVMIFIFIVALIFK